MNSTATQEEWFRRTGSGLLLFISIIFFILGLDILWDEISIFPGLGATPVLWTGLSLLIGPSLIAGYAFVAFRSKSRKDYIRMITATAVIVSVQLGLVAIM